MSLDLTERTALVTGGGRGNGAATARALADHGASVVVFDLDAAPAEAVAEAVRDDGGEAVAFEGDVSDEETVEAAVAAGTERYGTVDVVVNNAGVGDAEPFAARGGDEVWQLNLDTHLWGAIYCTKHALPGMVERGYGKVVNLTSIHTKNGIGMSPQYDVAKYALLGLTKSLALELGGEGVRVNAVAPGFTETRMTESFADATRERILDLNPLGRFAEPGEVAEAVLWLASPASDYVNGHELRVDGGQAPIDNWKHRDSYEKP